MITDARISEILSNAAPLEETDSKIQNVKKDFRIGEIKVKNGNGNITIISGSTILAVALLITLLFF